MPFLAGFLLTALLTPLVMAAARRLGWMAPPREDRWHTRPIPLMGGVAIFAGAAAAWAIYGDPAFVQRLGIPAAAVFVLGLADDRLGLRPHHKLLGQFGAAALLLALGTSFEAMPAPVAVAITVLWVVAITNAVNLLDNMDGLAAGVCAISALVMAAPPGGQSAGGPPPVTAEALGLAGACAGFLLHNFHPARVFMGDCGSMFLGFSLAAIGVQGTHRTAPNLLLSLLVPVSVLAIPIFDTLLVSVARALHGRSIAEGGRDHSSHRLVLLGLSERGTVCVLYGLTAVFGALALMATRVRLLVLLPLAGLFFLGLGSLGLYLGFLKVYQVDGEGEVRGTVLGGRLQYARQRLQMVLDAALVPIAFVGAHLLRFEGEPPPEIVSRMLAVLPAVMVAKLLGLTLCRGYRGVWRSAGAADALAGIAGSTAGSLLAAAVIALWGGFRGLSRAALIMDWILFTALAVCARLGYVLLQTVVAMLAAPHGPKVLMLGGGPEAMSLMSSLRDPFSPRRARIVGILDDDAGRHGRSLNGIPVLGPITELPRLMEAEGIHCCILGVAPDSEDGRRILAFCRERQIPVYPDLSGVPAAG